MAYKLAEYDNIIDFFIVLAESQWPVFSFTPINQSNWETQADSLHCLSSTQHLRPNKTAEQLGFWPVVLVLFSFSTTD
jgi:hypothetical protein